MFRVQPILLLLLPTDAMLRSVGQTDRLGERPPTWFTGKSAVLSPTAAAATDRTPLLSLRARPAIWLILCLPGSLLSSSSSSSIASDRGAKRRKEGRKPGQPPLSGGDLRTDWRQGHFWKWSHSDRERIHSPPSLPPSFICRTSQSPQNVWPVGGSAAAEAAASLARSARKKPEPDPNYKGCGR